MLKSRWVRPDHHALNTEPLPLVDQWNITKLVIIYFLHLSLILLQCCASFTIFSSMVIIYSLLLGYYDQLASSPSWWDRISYDHCSKMNCTLYLNWYTMWKLNERSWVNLWTVLCWLLVFTHMWLELADFVGLLQYLCMQTCAEQCVRTLQNWKLK